MWIPRNVFESLVKDRAEAQGAARAVEQHNIALQTTMDWMTMRLTQLEHERAQLIQQYMGVKIDVPSIEPAPSPITAETILNSMPSFEDVGDEEAQRMGIGWDAHGEVTYAKK